VPAPLPCCIAMTAPVVSRCGNPHLSHRVMVAPSSCRGSYPSSSSHGGPPSCHLLRSPSSSSLLSLGPSAPRIHPASSCSQQWWGVLLFSSSGLSSAVFSAVDVLLLLVVVVVPLFVVGDRGQRRGRVAPDPPIEQVLSLVGDGCWVIITPFSSSYSSFQSSLPHFSLPYPPHCASLPTSGCS
jgi:hypothetical protein